MGWTHGKENQEIDEIPFLSLGIRRTEFNNLSFDISSMTWVIVRHWTRKFLIVAISSDYFKHVRIW
ncbi:hypothetical protein RhiirB3_450914 [Rhizophagus irregularis]|nr:hypothetical protein RhiirB3_450914 [Rhizophagus irregularis]